MRILLALCLFISLFTTSCKPEKIEPNEQTSYLRDTGYFPLGAGYWWEYQVMQIAYKDDILKPFGDTARLYLRVVIDSAFTDGEGETAWLQRRYRRADSTQPWKLFALWSMKLDGNEAQVVEENARYIKLDLPIETGKTWLGNKYNNVDTLSPIGPEWTSHYQEADVPWSSGAIDLMHTALVNHLDYFNIFERRKRSERYARGVGLVYKENIDTNYYRGYTATAVRDTGKIGIYQQTLLRYGK